MRFNEATKETVKMRDKGDAVDYKYYTEPNILPIQLDEAWIEEIKNNLPEMADARAARYVADFQLPEKDAAQLVVTKTLSDYYEQCTKHCNEYKLIANWLLVEVPAFLSKHSVAFEDMKMQPNQLASMVKMIKEGTISSKQGKEVFEEMMNTGKNPEDIANEKGMKQMSDSSALVTMIEEVLANNPSAIEDYRNGKTRAVGFIVGQVMKASRGQANPQMTNKLVKEIMDSKL